MKTALFKTAFILFLIPFFSLANCQKDGEGKYTREKSVKREFTVNRDALLKIKNSYGDITIVTNNSNVATFDILIKTNGNDEEKVKQKLDDIDIEFDASNSEVYARTVFNKDNNKSWWNWGKKNHVNMQINYRVSIPMTNDVNLNNDYGNINLDKLEGRATINCDYGKITTKELMAENNSLSFDYTNNSYFEYINSAKINADYSGFTVAKAKGLQINADYTNSKVEICEIISYNCDYGALEVDNINNIKGSGDYIKTYIGKIYGHVEISQDYGSIRIGELTDSAGNVSIQSDYVGIEIGYSANYGFNFDIILDYGSLRSEDNFEMTTKIEKNSNKQYVGRFGNGNNNLKINSNYGSVTFKKKN